MSGRPRVLYGVWLALMLSLLPAKAMATPDPLARLRELYLEAVQHESAIADGVVEIETLRAGGVARGSRLDATLQAYHGALTTLRAKHAVWPPARMRHLRDGLAALDAVVAEHSGIAEVRYLRLMSCYFLPGFLGRRDTVREDFAALARLLPGARREYPADAYAEVVRFVLQKGRLEPEQRQPLERALRAAMAQAEENDG